MCLTPPGDQQLPVTATITWLNRYLKGDSSVNTGPGFKFVDQNGSSYTASDFPVPTGTPVTAEGHGTLGLVSTGGSGPDRPGWHPGPGRPGRPITPAKAANAVNVTVTFGNQPQVVVGAPRLQLTYHGTAPGGPTPPVFAQLVNESTGLVLGNQITPIDVTLDGHSHTATVPLEMVAYTGQPHAAVELQLVATTVAYRTPRLGGASTSPKSTSPCPWLRPIRAK